MARVIKIDNALKKQFATKVRKNNNGKEIVTYFLIVCEGEQTEPNYFKSFPKRVGKFVFDIQLEGGGISTLKVVEKAIELRENSSQKYDRVWAVFDKDSFKANSFNSAIMKAKANGIECAWSNAAFELWYILHFHNRVTAMDREDYKKALEAAINSKIKPNKGKFKYLKNSIEMYEILKQFGNQTLAISWAKELDEKNIGESFSNFNPCTQVYKLVLELNGKSDKLNAEIIDQINTSHQHTK